MTSTRTASVGVFNFYVSGGSESYVVNAKGQIATENLGWEFSPNWLFKGVSFHPWRNGIDVPFDPKTNPKEYVGGYVWDLDHGTTRRWGRKIIQTWRDTAEMAERRTWNTRRSAKELLVLAKEMVAGDEWMDEKTFDFARAVAQAMRRTRGVRLQNVSRNVVRFTYSPDPFTPAVPLHLTLMEFGYGDQSESVNGTITSPSHSGFVVPGGFTKSRNPDELWKLGKQSLDEIIEMARGRTARSNFGYEAWKALENARNNLSTAMSRLQVILNYESPDDPGELQRMVASLEQMGWQLGAMRSTAHALMR